MPLYPDEVAYRIMSGRFLFDGGIQYYIFPECVSNTKAVPLFFYPAAIILAGIEALPYWKLVRVIPFLSVITLMGAVFSFNWKMNKSSYIPLFFSAGFIGIAGSGFALSRPEIFLIFHGAICLFAYSYCISGSLSRSMAIILLILLYVASLTSFFAHLQGLIFVPLTLMLMYRISKSFNGLTAKLMATLSTLYIFLAVWSGFVFIGSFRCSESPQIAQFISSMTLPGWLKTSGAKGVSNYLRDEFFQRFTYFERFQFGPKYQVDYLPPTNYNELNLGWFFRVVNDSIVAMSGIILVAFVILCIYLFIKVIIQLKTLRGQSTPCVSKLESIASSYEVAYLMTCLAHLSLLFYVTQLNFYRVFYINLAMVVLLLVALNQTENQVIKRTALTIGFFSLLLCSVSAGIANQFISPKLESGYSGPSLPLATNWVKVRENVTSLKKACGIADEDTGIIVDDKTYDAMKKHRHIFPVTYLGLSSAITGKPVTDLIQDIGAKAALTRCDYFDTFQITSKSRVDDLCCTTFKPGRI